MKKLFGTDGIRGEANTELSPKIAFWAGFYSSYVLGRDTKNLKVIIGRDTRLSGNMLETAFASGAMSAGANVVSIGIVATPAIPHLIKKFDATIGVMISASHNPSQFNGIKLFNSLGFKLNDETETEIENLILENEKFEIIATSDKIGTYTIESESYKIYEDILKNSIDVNLKGKKICLDCANGSNYLCAPEVFKKLGADVISIGNKPNGTNINKNCGSTNLEAIKREVVNNSADIGIAFDGDADRVLAIDEEGKEIDGDRIMLALAKHMKSEGKLNKDTLVITVMSNMGLEKALKAENIKTVRTKVGDKYVLEKMLSENYSLGGEQSGHIIISNQNTTGDGLLAALTLLEIMSKNNCKASDFNNAMQSYPQVLVNVEVANKIKYDVVNIKEVNAAISSVSSKLGDSGRVLIRASGTEPLLRVMIEGKDKDTIEKHAKYIANTIIEQTKYL